MKLKYLDILSVSTALKELNSIPDIPILASLDIAIISNTIDTRVKAYQMAISKLYKDLSVTVSQEGDNTKFECILKDASDEVKTANIKKAVEGINELLNADAEELTFKKIQLPKEVNGKTLQLKPEILKPLVEFIEVI